MVTLTMPKILPSSAWIEFRGAPRSKTLNEGALHFAIVKGSDGTQRKCAVKLIDLSTRPGLLCEGLGWLLAQASGVNVPLFAAILRVPLTELNKAMPLPSFVDGHAEYLAWCVEIVEGKAVSQVQKWFFWLSRLRCLYAKNTPVIAAFDYWADNQDRNYGNVIRSKDGQYIAIDHEAILHEALWNKYFGLQFSLNSLLEDAKSKLTPSQLHKFKCEMALASKIHDNALKSIKTVGLNFFCSLIPDQSSAITLWAEIETFLALRAQLGWLSDELRVIV